jgi:Sel1 repeat
MVMSSPLMGEWTDPATVPSRPTRMLNMNTGRARALKESEAMFSIRVWVMGVAFLVIGLLAAVTVPDLLRGDYFELCMNFSPGEGIGGQRRQRDHEARCLKWAAERGDVSAQAQLGDWYADRQDHSEAVRWWQRAAQAGNVHAQIGLADSYFGGRGVEQDHGGAAYWYSAPVTAVSMRNRASL